MSTALLAGYAPARLAAEFDALLPDSEGNGAFSARRCAELDRAEEFPAAICSLLDSLGLPACYVPSGLGGTLTSFENLVWLVRGLARRDLTVAVAHAKTFLGAASVWVGGDHGQAVGLARQVMAGARVCWALSEPGHGADLLAGEVTARGDGRGYLVTGAKWPVNNATLGSHACLLARTGEAGGPRGYSLLLAGKAELDPGSYRYLPKVRTHGIRGADISGIEFTGARLPEAALVGEAGTGLETVLRTLQVTRTMCAALSLGAGEHALRLATEFVAGRIIQGRPLIDRRWVRAVLARSAALLLTAEAVTIVASRAVHELPGEMSVISAVVKALVPSLIDQMIDELAELLGARSFLDCVYADGAFQKTQRDHRIVAIFDGSTVVNRSALIGQFPRLAAGYLAARYDSEGLAASTRLLSPPRPLDLGGAALRLSSPAGCSVVQSMSQVCDQAAGASTALGLLTRAVRGHADSLHASMSAGRPASHPAAAAFGLAASYELCFAAAACLHLWQAGQDTAAAPLWNEALWDEALWLRACLAELAARLDAGWDGKSAVVGEAVAGPASDELAGWLAAAVRDGQPLSLCQAGPAAPGRPRLATDEERS
jgi:alkylation response protein AidB-like acyl-CoA dehydrogenase